MASEGIPSSRLETNPKLPPDHPAQREETPMTSLRIAGAQLPVSNDISENVAAIRRAIRFAHEADADLLLTPEGSLSGYTPDFDPDEAREALDAVSGEAKSLGLGLALGTCFIEPDDGLCYNELRFYDRDGVFLGFHSKTLRCGSLTEPPRGEINDYAARPLQVFDFHGVTVGGLICNDLWANPGCTPMPDPHLTQELANRGAKVILHAVNGGRDGSEWSEVNGRFHESNLRMRAQAGRLWIATADNCAPAHLPCSAPSGVVSPDGRWACRTEPKGERFFCHSIEIGAEG
jgi:predicted amidohydrolase